MIKISSVVTNIVHSSDFALEGLQKNCLNLSAYAELIQPEVERTVMKTVTKSSIVIALSRIASDLPDMSPLFPTVAIQSVTTRLGLFEVSFDSSADARKRLTSLQLDPSFEGDHFLNIAIGVTEITLVASARDKNYILNEMKPRKPRQLVNGLGVVKVRIDKDTYNTPNVLYSMLKIMAIAKINIQSLTAAFNELTFIMSESDVKAAFLLLHDNYSGLKK